MKRALAGLACIALAAAVGLLARDVWRIDKALRDGDARADVVPVRRESWQAATTLPFDLAERLLGSRDDVDYRALLARAMALAEQPTEAPFRTRQRAAVEAALARVELGDADRTRASQAALVLGVLLYSDPEDPYRRVETPSDKASARFRAAVELDPDNEHAKRNLELMLQQQRRQNRRGPSAEGGGNTPGAGGAGLAPPGGGY